MIKLHIDDQEVDIGTAKDLNVKLNRSFLDLQNIESRSGDYSYTVKLPKTKNNNVIFSNINVLNVTDKFVKTEDYFYKLIVDGVTFEGIFKINSVDELYYNGILLSANISWSKLLAGKNLNELKNADGTNWTAEFIASSASTATNSLQWYIANTDFDNSDITFPLVSYGNFFHSSNNGFTNWIFDDSIGFEDIPPSVYILKIIKKIFEGINWNVDSSLFSSSEHKKLFMPFCASDSYKWNDYFLINASSSGNTNYVYQDLTTVPNNTFDIKVSSNALAPFINVLYLKPNTEIRDPFDRLKQITYNNLASQSKTLTAMDTIVTSNYDIDLTVNFATISGASPNATGIDLSHALGSNTYDNLNNFRAGVILYIHSDVNNYYLDVFENVSDYIGLQSSSISHPNVIAYYDIFRTPIDAFPTFFQPYDSDADIVVSDTLSYTYSNYIPNGTLISHFKVGGGVNFEIRNLKLGSNEQVRAAVVIHSISNLMGFNKYYVNVQDVSWSFRASDTGTTDTGINIGKNLPAISQLDFVKTWMAQNNLFVTADAKNKTVRFDTYDDFFLPLDFGYDITEKVDLNKNEPPIKPVELPVNIFFNYSNDLSDVLLEQDPDYGNLQITSDSIYASGDKTIQYLFSSTKFRDFTLFSALNSTTGQTVSLPSVANEQSFAVDDLPSIQWSFAGSPRILKTNGFIADSSGNTLFVGIDGFQTAIINSIFADTRENHLNLCNNGDNGLYTNYYERFLSDISESHVLTLNSIINGNDFNQMQPNVPILINNESYFTNSISAFDPINRNSTKIELIKRFTN